MKLGISPVLSFAGTIAFAVVSTSLASTGTTWTTQALPTVKALSRVTWGQNLFVAVGNEGTILTSPDAKTWTARNSGTTANLYDVVWNGKQFLAGGGGLQAGGRATTVTSSDGVSWRSQNVTSLNAIVAIASSANRYVVCAGEFATSADGASWTYASGSNLRSYNSVAWTGNLFVGVGETALNINGAVMTSPDGLSWSMQSQSPFPLHAVASNGATIVAVGQEGRSLVSSDGLNWTMSGVGSRNFLAAVASNGSLFVAAGSAGFGEDAWSIYSSPDGIKWVPRSTGSATTGIGGITYGNEQFVAVGGTVSNTAIIMTSGSSPVATQIDLNVSLPPVPTATPPSQKMPSPTALASHFTQFYADNRSNFDSQTQSYFDSEVIRLGQWLNSHKTTTVSNVFLKGADVIDVASHAISIGLSFLDFSKVFSGGAKALGSGAEQLSTVLNYSLGTASEVGALPDTADKVRSLTSAASDALAAIGGGGAPALLGLNATIWGDWVVPQLRAYGKDPPDPNFATAVIPQRVVLSSLPTIGSATADALLKAELQSSFDMGMYLKAANQTIDKYAGALNAGDSRYAIYQMEAFLAFMDLYDQASRKSASDVKALSDYLSTMGFTSSNQDPTILGRVQQQVRQNGFSQDVLNYLAAAGYSSTQITQLKSSFLGYIPSAISPDISFLGQLSAASMNLTSTTAASRLSNLSVRTSAGSGDTALIAGFVASGSSQEKLLIRGIGSSLAQFGVGGALSNVRLSLFNSQGTQTTQNTNWETAIGTAASASSLFAQLGAFPLQAGSKDAALNVFIFPGSSYSAQVSSNDGTVGIALVELYEDSTSPTTSHLVNISARCQVNTGAGILIAGFVVSGNSSKQLLIRGVGPSLSIFGVGGLLVNPKLQVFQGTTLIAENDDWGQASNPAAIQLTSQNVGAFALPNSSKDSVLLVTLPPGNYTAQVSGVGGTTGVALVELYEIP